MEDEVLVRVHNNPPLVPNQSRMNPVPILPPYSSKIRFSIILPFILGLQSSLFNPCF
jgi:hypothetical protein